MPEVTSDKMIQKQCKQCYYQGRDIGKPRCTYPGKLVWQFGECQCFRAKEEKQNV